VKKILIVEDEPGIRDCLVDLLKADDRLLFTTHDVKGALVKLAEGFVPDLLITDWQLSGGLGGARIVRELWSHEKRTPVIVITADCNPPIPADRLTVLRKPFEIDELLSTVDGALGSASAVLGG
jgi:DNA-binding response OmpR family regulator